MLIAPLAILISAGLLFALAVLFKILLARDEEATRRQQEASKSDVAPGPTLPSGIQTDGYKLETPKFTYTKKPLATRVSNKKSVTSYPSRSDESYRRRSHNDTDITPIIIISDSGGGGYDSGGGGCDSGGGGGGGCD